MIVNEANEVAERDEERFKFDLFTRNPEMYDQLYGSGADATLEAEIEEFNPENPEDVADLLAIVREMEEAQARAGSGAPLD